MGFRYRSRSSGGEVALGGLAFPLRHVTTKILWNLDKTRIIIRVRIVTKAHIDTGFHPIYCGRTTLSGAQTIEMDTRSALGVDPWGT